MITAFATYADERFAGARRRLVDQANATGWFDRVVGYTPADVPRDFRRRVGRHLTARRGGGYWLWKPIVMRAAMRDLSDGDRLVYADAGCQIPGGGLLQPYFDRLGDDASGTLSLRLPLPEWQWTAPKVLEHFGTSADDPAGQSGQLMATMVFFRVCEGSRRLVDDFCDLAAEHSILFTDAMAPTPPPANFGEHRHDQSIFSLLRKQHGTVVIDDNTDPNFTPAERLGPIQTARSRDLPPGPLARLAISTATRVRRLVWNIDAMLR